MLNHTSSSHPWFRDSASGADSPKRDWYVWSADDPGTTTDWGTPAWHAQDGSYYLGLFWEGMPDLNYANPAVTRQMYDVARFWLEDMGVDGFRLDAVRHLIEDGDRLEGTPQTHAWLRAWDDHLDSLEPESLTVGEVWDETSVAAPYVNDDEVDLAFEFSVAEAIIGSVTSRDPFLLTERLGTVLAAYPPGQFAPFLTNHDQNRVMTQLGGGVREPEMAKLAASALLTLPGVPFVYYGEEIGMLGEKPDEQIRTPMQWDSSANAGFTSGTPWEPVNADHLEVNVESELADPSSLLNRYRTLLQIRHDHQALSLGSIQLLDSSCAGVHASLRRTDDGADSVLVLLNFDTEQQLQCTLDAASSALPPGTYRTTDLLTGEAQGDVSVSEAGAISSAVPMAVAWGRAKRPSCSCRNDPGHSLRGLIGSHPAARRHRAATCFRGFLGPRTCDSPSVRRMDRNAPGRPRDARPAARS